MESKTIDVSGLKVHYIETRGTNAALPIIVLHGWASYAARWEEILSMLETKGIRAIVPDFPGRGETPEPQVPWELDDYTEFVLRFIRALQIKKYNLLGHSSGGRVAIKIAAFHNEGLEKLILLDAAGVTPRDKKRIFVYKISTKIGGLIFSLPLLRLFRPLARKIIYFFAGGYDFYALEGSMKKTFKNVISEDLTPYLDKITTRTHIIWGEKDRMTPLSDARLMHDKITDSKLTIVSGGSHSFYLDMPQRMAEEILKSL